MSKYIDAEKLIAGIDKLRAAPVPQHDQQCDFSDGYSWGLNDIENLIDSLQQEALEEEKARKKRYNESFMSYWKSVIDTIDNKRVLPSFKGQLLHEFKNELHTMKQIVGLINHPEIHEGLFDKLALVFAAWGGYHFHPKEILPEDSLQQEQPEPYFYCKYGGIMPLCSDCKRNHSNSSFKTEEITTWYTPSCGTKQCIDYIQQERPEVDLEKEMRTYCSSSFKFNYDELNDSFYSNAFEFDDVVELARHFYELGLNARKEE